MLNNNKIIYYQYEAESEQQQLEQPDIQQQYSTFKEELQQTTDKLMNDIFNTQYHPQIDLAEQQAKLKKARLERQYYTLTRTNLQGNKAGQKSQKELRYMFQNFINRNKKWCIHREKKIDTQKNRIETEEEKKLTFIPQILRGSKEKLAPLYERTLELHSSLEKEKKRKQLKKQQAQEEEIKKMSFHPVINDQKKTRTLEQYLKDKEEWQKNKNNSIQEQKIRNKAKQYMGCTFNPQLVSRQKMKNSGQKSSIRPQKVEDRLISSLETSYQAKLSFTN